MSGSIIPPGIGWDDVDEPLTPQQDAYREAQRALAPDTLRAMGFGQTTRPWHGLGALTDRAAEMETILGAQLAEAIEQRDYQADRARYWCDLANARQGEINRLRANLDNIIGG